MNSEKHHPQSGGQPQAGSYDQPVAYDQQGRPLYAHPPQQGPQMVYVARPMNPERPEIPEDIRVRAEESAKKYPRLNLSDGEYIIAAVKRHPIGILLIWGAIFFVIGVFAAMMYMLFIDPNSSMTTTFGDEEQTKSMVVVILSGIAMLGVIGGLIATYIYTNNRFYLTNESVIQEIQTTLFSKHEQTVSLSNVEDASYRQNNILQMMLNYGSIRLSTEGDETTYRFSYVTNPKKHIAILNNAVEAFKNGRPVHPDPNDDQPS
jgi:uncharacterized membrane protein YdbT with pleckstrin-like domain